MSAFTEAEDATLRRLWDEGHSTPEIGRRMGRSKNSIVGRAHRLDLPERPSPIIRDGRKPAPRVKVAHYSGRKSVTTSFDNPRRGAIVGPTLPPHQLASLGRRPPLPPQMQESLSVEQLRLKLVNAGPCQFPIWPHNERPPRDLSKRFCSKPVARIGSPYCEACRRIAYTKKREDEQELDMPAFVMVAGRRVLTDEGKRRIVAGQKRRAV